MTDEQILMRIVGGQHRINILKGEIDTEIEVSVIKSKVNDIIETFDRMEHLQHVLQSRQLDRLKEELES